MAFIKPEQWEAYRNIINEWQEDAFQQDIIWEREVTTVDRYGEDENKRTKRVTLKGLAQYNYYRSWPLNTITTAGELDKENLLLFLNIKWLGEQGYLNTQGQFDFQPDYDRFIINGIKYKAFGDSEVSQAHNKPLLTFIILKREEIQTGQDRINQV